VQLEQGPGGGISSLKSCSSAAVTANATVPDDVLQIPNLVTVDAVWLRRLYVLFFIELASW
jgi:hypothetical protein